ncbi:bifunctional riboflavin kinase/FAD synthetase [Compostibacter hankyongensis]|uniref:Riboflavin biosynthesis protein n=1 Tax=Compostibacter hankyongensis TaxID=1007089 RepID=A0ABP8FHA7_9BACT
MLVHRDLDHLPAFQRAVLTIGTFDGVHCGHRQVIRQLRETAAACNGESVIITFEPHPREVLFPGNNDLHLLNTLDEKIRLLEQQGVDHLVIVPFTNAFSSQPAAAYIEDFLVRRFCPYRIIIGYDHHFGHQRQGNIGLLREVEARYGFRVVEIPPQVVHHLTVSSTKIREHLEAGHVALANELLGYDYFLSGTVVHGDRRGRELGYPTANIRPADKRKLIPGSGIYAVRARLDPAGGDGSALPEASSWLPAVMSIGYRPTFNGTDLRVEVHIFDFSADIYDRMLTVSLCDFIRPELKFENAEALVRQIEQDAQTAREMLIR